MNWNRLAALSVLLLMLGLSACAAQAQGGANYGQAPASSHPDREVLVPASGQHPDRELKSFPDQPRPNVPHWGAIDNGTISLMMFALKSGRGPESAGKLWRSRSVQVCVYGYTGQYPLEQHPGFIQALAHARAIRDGRFGPSCGQENCFYQSFQ